MYALIYKGGHFLGFFSSKRTMKIVIEALIKDLYQKDGVYGDFHFQYIELNIDEPWITKNGKEAPPESRAILSFYTMHSEKFIHKIKTDWNTGEIISMDADSTNNLND